MFGRNNSLGAVFVVLLFASCGGGGGSSEESLIDRNSQLVTSIIESYVDDVVVGTYADLKDKATALKEAVEDVENGTQNDLDVAKNSWIESRIPWEQSEAWLFGPVDSAGYDPALDSWPVNRTDLDGVLASADDLTEEYISQLDPTLKGFHTVEYLLYEFSADQLNANSRRIDYLIGTAKDIESTAMALHASWTEGQEPYGEVMKSAGDEGNTVFPSQLSALEQMIEGMSIILVEVGTGKIADPFDQRDTELVESQFSFNSRADFANDIVGVLNVYMGCRASIENRTCDGDGLKDLVAQADTDLADRVEREINAAIDAILNISQPFRDAILDPDQSDQIKDAQEAIAAVDTTLKGSVLPLIRR